MGCVFGFGGECSGGGGFVRKKDGCSVWTRGEGEVGRKLPLLREGLGVMLDKNENVCYNGSVRG